MIHIEIFVFVAVAFFFKNKCIINFYLRNIAKEVFLKSATQIVLLENKDY